VNFSNNCLFRYLRIIGFLALFRKLEKLFIFSTSSENKNRMLYFPTFSSSRIEITIIQFKII